ncbi:MAG: hypothetical protein JXR56_05650 [Candidatus Cloacimonetes bacterium]|nr:hypothetical protein [Candidatus Cloacimonadota bacterium]
MSSDILKLSMITGILRITVILISMLLLSSCLEKEIYRWSDDWVTTMNNDGTSLKYIYRDAWQPYYVTDFTDNLNEKVVCLIDDGVVSMNPDGSAPVLIIPDIDHIYEVSWDRTMLLLGYDEDIYIARVDGTELLNITNTPNTAENYASFSADASKVVYTQIITKPQTQPLNALILYDIETGKGVSLFSERFSTGLSIMNKRMVNDLIFFEKAYTDGISKSGVYCYDLSNESISMVYQGKTVSSLVSNYCDKLYFPDNDLHSIIELDIPSLNTTEIFHYTDEYYSQYPTLSLSPTGVDLLVTFKYNYILNLNTLDYCQLTGFRSSASFNRIGTKIICLYSRSFPE